MNELPCTDCLIFPVCKMNSKHEFITNDPQKVIELIDVVDLILRCDLFKKWIKIQPPIVETHLEIAKVYELDTYYTFNQREIKKSDE